VGEKLNTPGADTEARRDVDCLRVDLDAGRRAFIKHLTLGTAGAVVLGSSAGFPTQANAQAAITDKDILNFALNLEYLEAEYYLRAAYGRGLAEADISGVGALGNVAGGRKVEFETDDIMKMAREIANDEEAHVKFLRSALGEARVARPQINLKSSFTAAARAAGLVKGNEVFDPYANENNFLLGAFIFEDVGVTAYKGAAPLITDKGILEAAAGLLAVEAYHAGEIRTLLYLRKFFKEAEAISDARDSLDGPADKDQGLRAGGGVANVVPTDQNGLAFSRNAREVLNIVYLAPGTPAGGGFFPNGVNGTIK
jgi:hypothetical protein